MVLFLETKLTSVCYMTFCLAGSRLGGGRGPVSWVCYAMGMQTKNLLGLLEYTPVLV